MFLSITQKKIGKHFFGSIIILRFGQTKVAEEEFYSAKKANKILRC